MPSNKYPYHSTWIKEIDYLRGFAILAVIIIHTSANFTEVEYLNNLVIINIFIDVFSHFAVPLFIFTSELEGFGQVLLESMASGTPVVCANKLPMSEIVGNGGVTFKLNNSIDLADKIIDLLENKDKIIKLRKKALERVKTEYNWSPIIRKFIEYIKSLKF